MLSLQKFSGLLLQARCLAIMAAVVNPLAVFVPLVHEEFRGATLDDNSKLRELFGTFGSVSKVHRSPSHFAIVTFDSAGSAQAALRASGKYAARNMKIVPSTNPGAGAKIDESTLPRAPAGGIWDKIWTDEQFLATSQPYTLHGVAYLLAMPSPDCAARAEGVATGILAACICQAAFPSLPPKDIVGYFLKPGHIRVSIACAALTNYTLPAEVTFQLSGSPPMRYFLRWDVSKSTETTERAHYYLRGPALHPFLRESDFFEWMRAQLRGRGWNLCTYHIQRDVVTDDKLKFEMLTGWAAITLTKADEHASGPSLFKLRRDVSDDKGRTASLAVDFSRIPADALVPSYGCVRAARPPRVEGAAAAAPAASVSAAPAAPVRAAFVAHARSTLTTLADAAPAASASAVPAALAPAALAQAAARVTSSSFGSKAISWLASFGSAKTKVRTLSASVLAGVQQALQPDVPHTHQSAFVLTDDGGSSTTTGGPLRAWTRRVTPEQSVALRDTTRHTQ